MTRRVQDYRRFYASPSSSNFYYLLASAIGTLHLEVRRTRGGDELLTVMHSRTGHAPAAAGVNPRVVDTVTCAIDHDNPAQSFRDCFLYRIALGGMYDTHLTPDEAWDLLYGHYVTTFALTGHEVAAFTLAIAEAVVRPFTVAGGRFVC